MKNNCGGQKNGPEVAHFENFGRIQKFASTYFNLGVFQAVLPKLFILWLKSEHGRSWAQEAIFGQLCMVFGAGLLCWCSQAAQMKVFSQNLSAEQGLWAWLCPAGLWSRAGCHPLGTPALALSAAIPLLSHLFVQKLWHLRARSKRTFWGGAGGLCVARKKHLQTAKMDVSLTKAKNT